MKRWLKVQKMATEENKIELYSDPECTIIPKSLKWQNLKDSFFMEYWMRNEGKHDFFIQDLIHDDPKVDASVSSDVIYFGQVIKITFRYMKTVGKLLDVPICDRFILHGYFKIPPKPITKASGGSGIATFENGEPIESPTYELDTPEKLHERAKKAWEKMRLENEKGL